MNIPEMRFPEFSGEWEEKKIAKILEIKYGKDYKHLNEGNIPVYGTGGLMTHVDDYLYDQESVLIGRKGTISKPFYVKGKFWTVDTLFYTKIFGADSKFTFYLLSTINWLKYNEASGVPSLSANNIKNIKVKIPPFSEQEKIASFLSKVDEKIEKLEKKHKLWETYKKGMMQKIFSQELRFKDEKGEDYPEWEERKFSEILFEHKEKSAGNEEVYSVSVHKGLVNQVEHLGRTFAAKDTSKYNLVKMGDIVYTKSPTGDFPLGIIKQSKVSKAVLVSPLYGVFTPETKFLGTILDAYFESPINTKNYLHPIVQKGAKNTMNISNSTFLSRGLVLPIDKKEEEAISNFIDISNKRIIQISNELNLIIEFKKGLLQQMFC